MSDLFANYTGVPVDEDPEPLDQNAPHDATPEDDNEDL